MKKSDKFLKALASVILAASLAMAAASVAFATDGEGSGGEGSNLVNQTADYSTLNDWKSLFGNETKDTDNAGVIWADKSVFGDDSRGSTNDSAEDELVAALGSELKGDARVAFQNAVEVGDDTFLVTLSSIASSKSVTGYATAPTDTMIILDLSSSMYNGTKRTPGTVTSMVASVNNTLDKLLKLNDQNRVGVVVYFGGPNLLQSEGDTALVMLPLDRYTAGDGGNYLTASVSGNQLNGVSVAKNVKNSAGATMPIVTRATTGIAGTYIQLGIQLARGQFMAADTDLAFGGADPAERTPVFVLMSDGEPTATSSSFANVGKAQWGSNWVEGRNPAESDFATQLTASYSKEVVGDHYGKNPLFYTLSLGYDISEDVMNPAVGGTDAGDKTRYEKITGYWQSLMSDDEVTFSVNNCIADYDHTMAAHSFTVKKTQYTAEDGTEVTFPSDNWQNQRAYVDKAFTAATASDLNNAFSNIFSEIHYQSAFNPTRVDHDTGEQLSGYVEFYDTISKFMEVKDIEGILYGGGFSTRARCSVPTCSTTPSVPLPIRLTWATSSSGRSAPAWAFRPTRRESSSAWRSTTGSLTTSRTRRGRSRTATT